MKKTIQEIVTSAAKYAVNYPGQQIDDETREAIYWSHLAYLLNTLSR